MIRFKDPAVRAAIAKEVKRQTAANRAAGAARRAELDAIVKGADRANVGRGPKFVPVTLSLEQAMIDRLDNWAHQMRKTRSAAIRVLLAEALK